MTFLETGAMTRQYREAEAILLPGSGPGFLTAAPPAVGRTPALGRAPVYLPAPTALL